MEIEKKDKRAGGMEKKDGMKLHEESVEKIVREKETGR